MNILQITAKAPKWGFDLFNEIEASLIHKDHSVTTVFLSGSPYPESAARYKGKTCFLELNHKSIFWRFSALFTITRLVLSNNYDAVISHHYKPSSIIAFIDRIAPVPRLFMINHNPGNLRRKARTYVIKYLFSYRWHYLCVSEWVRRDFLNHAPFIKPESISVLYNCIDILAIQQAQHTRAEARKHLGLDETDFVFGNIHRLDPSKGHDYLIRAFAKVANDMPNARLVIIGGGDRKQLLEDIARECHVSDQVNMAGMLPKASSFTPAFDVFVSPSLHEGFGLGLLEGMAASIPTIVSTGGASPEVVGDTGLLFPPGDEAELAKQLLACYKMPAEKRASMGKQSLQRLKDCFSKETYHQNVRALVTGD